MQIGLDSRPHDISNRKHLLFPRAIDIIIVIRTWSFAMAKLFDLKFSPE